MADEEDYTQDINLDEETGDITFVLSKKQSNDGQGNVDSQSLQRAQENAAECTEVINDDKIELIVQASDDRFVKYRLRLNAEFKKLFINACERFSMKLDAVAFMFDGTRINAKDTPEKLGMRDKDTIDIFERQIGGSPGS